MKQLEIVTNPYNQKQSKNLKGLIVRGYWDDSIITFIKKNNIKALYLNSAKGWKQKNYSFLSKLNSIEELDIISSEAEGLVHIEKMNNLISLSISTNTQDIIDFSKLLNLQNCYIAWWKGAESILDCTWLRKVYLDERKIVDFSKLGRFSKLESLVLANTRIESIEFLNELNDLKELELYNCRKLLNFKPIQHCKNLKKLSIEGCSNLSNLEFIRELTSLEILNISDNSVLESLAPLKKLENLRAFSFAGNTKIKDGDLGVLDNLPKLSMLMFQPHRHYTHTLMKPWDWKNFNYPDKVLKKK
ncbi:MAG: hypothetical protein KJ017_02665 [Alphaproteobacteria bacterium]|nr:hypothetical protein [Alphaproteobacteria bacterium]